MAGLGPAGTGQSPVPPLPYNEHSAMTTSAARHLEPPTIASMNRPVVIQQITPRPNRLLGDWRICLLVLMGLWAVIYLAGL